jgi:hypothetical protein
MPLSDVSSSRSIAAFLYFKFAHGIKIVFSAFLINFKLIIRPCNHVDAAHTRIIQVIQSAVKEMKETHFKGGKIFDKQFNIYQIPRFPRVPKIETVLV